MARRPSKKTLRARALKSWETRRANEAKRLREERAEARARARRQKERRTRDEKRERELQAAEHERLAKLEARRIKRASRKVAVDEFPFGALEPKGKPARGKKAVPPPPESSGTLKERARGKKALAAQAKKIAALEAKIEAQARGIEEAARKEAAFKKRSEAAIRGHLHRAYNKDRLLILPNVHGSRPNDRVVLRAMIETESTLWKQWVQLGENHGISMQQIRNTWFSPKGMFQTPPSK